MVDPDTILSMIAPPAKEAFIARCEREGLSVREGIKNALYAYAIEEMLRNFPFPHPES